MKISRATLRASLKYPWFRTKDGEKHKKWGVYLEDQDAFHFAFDECFAQDGEQKQKPRRTIEAEIMDWADDAAYAIDDMIDFYTVGMIPLDRLAVKETDEGERFLAGFFDRKNITGTQEQGAYTKAWNEIREILKQCGIKHPYNGRMSQRRSISELIFQLHNFLRESTTLSASTASARFIPSARNFCRITSRKTQASCHRPSRRSRSVAPLRLSAIDLLL